MTDGFERRKEQKKESIRRAAMELFQAHGFNKVTISDIAHKANVSHVTIYNHFGSKEDLVRDVIRAITLDIIARAREIIESDIPFVEKLQQLMYNKTSVALQYQGELVKAVARDYPEMKRFLGDLYDKEANKLMDKLVEEGKRLKYINPDLSPQSIRYYFMMIRNGLYADKEMLESIEMDDKTIRDLNYLWLFGLIEKQE